MKTLAKVLIPLLLIVFVVAPGVTGFLVESEIDKSRDQVTTRLSDEGISLLDSNFKRGWFGSDQSAELEFDDPTLIEMLHAIAGPEHSDELPTLVVETKATHGVLPLASPSKGGLKPAMAQTQSQLFLKYPSGGKIELPVTVYASLGMGSWAKLVAEPINRKIDNNGEVTDIKWEGADIEGSGDFQDNGSFNGKIGSLNLSSEDGIIALAPTKLSGKFNKGKYAYHESQFDVAIPFADVEMADGNTLSFKDLAVNASLNTVNDRAAGSQSFSTGKISVAGVDVNSTDLSMKFDLDAQAFSEFYALAQKANSEDGGSSDPAAMQAALTNVLAKGGSLNFEKFDVDLDGSMIHLDLKMDVPAGHSDVRSALQSAKGAGQVVLPQAAVDMLTAISQEVAFVIQMGTGSGFIEKKGDQYIADIIYEDGLLLLNGLPMQLPF